MVFFGCILLTNILASGWNDYDIPLQREYHLLRTNAYTIMIYKESEGFVVPPKIIGLGIKRSLIYGVCEKIKESDIEGISGYFLLDTQKSIAKVGLTKTDWLGELKKYNISKEPILKKPSRYWNLVNNFKIVLCAFLSWCLIFIVIAVIYNRKMKKRQFHLAQMPPHA